MQSLIVVCFVSVCSDGDIRLSGGLTESEGTVEFCFDNLWGLVAQSGWSTPDAEVTCRQLGYPSEGAWVPILFGLRNSYFILLFSFYFNAHAPAGAQAVLNSFYGKPDRTLHLSTVVCTGSEDKLAECNSATLSLEDGKDIVKHVDVAGVSCKRPTSTFLPTLSSTLSAEVNERLISYSAIYIIFGVLGSTILIGILIIIMWVL